MSVPFPALLLAVAGLLSTSCSTSGDPRLSLGASGAIAHLQHREWSHEHHEEAHGILVDGERLDLRGRTVQVDVAAGPRFVQAIVGREWGRVSGESYLADLWGVRVPLGRNGDGLDSFVSFVVRNVHEGHLHHGWFDGFDLGVGGLVRLGGPWCAEVRLSWSVLDGDAIGPNVESLSEERMLVGLRLEF